ATAYLDEAEQCGHVVMLHEGQILAASEPKAFAERLRGHVFSVSPAAGVRPRTIQGQLIGQPGIVDATIRNGRVRTVTADPDATPIRAAAPTTLDGIHPTTPSFEDAFIKALADLQRPAPSARTPAATSPAPAARSQADVVVQARDLTKRFGDFVAVSGVTFEVTRGEIFGLLGPNGAGKSTTFRMLCGLSKVSAGEVSVAGHDLRRSGGTARQQLGYMAQQFSLYANLTVRENLRFYGRAYGLSADRLKHRMAWALSEFELAERSDEAAGALPGGYKQRLAMAASLLHEPQILFLDEPTSGVDPIARRDFWRRINAFAEAGVTVIVTTHFMEEAEYCDRMLIMSQGKTLAMGTPAEIRAMARTATQPDPTIEDAFIALAEGHVRPGQGSAS
ncbi:MAG: ABC transporter ATP-binding protein, partial [Tepidisphaeraceae bacterium]